MHTNLVVINADRVNRHGDCEKNLPVIVSTCIALLDEVLKSYHAKNAETIIDAERTGDAKTSIASQSCEEPSKSYEEVKHKQERNLAGVHRRNTELLKRCEGYACMVKATWGNDAGSFSTLHIPRFFFTIGAARSMTLGAPLSHKSV